MQLFHRVRISETIKLSTSLFQSKENLDATHKLQTQKQYRSACIKSSQFKSAQVSRFGLAVRRSAGKRKDLGSIPLRLSFFFKNVVVCGHCLVTLSITSYRNLKMALIAAHLNAGGDSGDSVAIGI